MPGRFHAQPIPAQSGIGLRAEHYRQVLDQLPDIGFVEVHSENYFGDGGKPLRYLESIREHYPLSLHGVGLSLGSTDPLDREHLARLARLIDRFAPTLVSEHLSWGSAGGIHSNDLLPLPLTDEALRHLCTRIDEVQDCLGRRILVENISSYLEFRHSTIPEWEFIDAVSANTGCGILLDVNNIYVNATNHGFDPVTYVNSVTPDRVGELHLAGFTVNSTGAGEILIDTHNRPVHDAVWKLYAPAVARFPHAPTLVEWDSDLPPLATLVQEARKADRIRLSHARVA